VIRCINLLLALILPFGGLSQINDDFSDGDFSAGPPWFGDSSKFIINTSFSLQSQGEAISETISLWTHSDKLENQIWEFWVQTHFSPSSSNHARIYLAADSTPGQNPDGYFIKLGGESGDQDGIDLYSTILGNSTKLIDGIPGLFSGDTNRARLKIFRDFVGNWTLELDTVGAGTNFMLQGIVFDTSFTKPEKFGVWFKHTSTRKDGFYFDDLLIRNGPFKILSGFSLSDSILQIQFSSKIEASQSLNPQNFTLKETGTHPFLVEPVSGDTSKANLHFTFPLSGGQNMLYLENLEDDQGNLLISDSILVMVTETDINYRDIVINEIFFDPSPQIGLPKGEFIEIYNTSEAVFDLGKLSIGYKNQVYPFPGAYIFPGDYITICSKEIEEEYSYFGTVMGLEDFPTLLNSGGTISLFHNNQILIDRSSYSTDLFSNPSMVSGGFSLEQKNPFQACSGGGNWDGSLSPEGGSPSQANSILSLGIDSSINQLISWETTSPFFLILNFRKGMDPGSLDSKDFDLSDDLTVSSVSLLDTVFFNQILLGLSRELKEGKIYSISAEQITDCQGMNFNIPPTSFGVGRMPQLGDLIISEYLPIEPLDSSMVSSEFIELLNLSDDLLELGKIQIRDLSSTAVFPPATLIRPGEYLIVSKDPDFNHQVTTAFLFLSSLPTINNSGETLWLKNQNLNTLQRVSYDPNFWQEESSFQGRSVEIINPWNWCEGNNNWAINTSEYLASPGYQNSTHDPFRKGADLGIRYCYMDSDSMLRIGLNQNIDSLKSAISGSIEFSNGEYLSTFQINHDLPASISLFPFKTAPNEIPESLRIKNFISCAGTGFNSDWEDIHIPMNPFKGSLVINEILFNPGPIGTDFIEILNRSEYSISISDLHFLRKDEDGYPIEDQQYQFLPGFLKPKEFLVLTEDSTRLKNRFPMAPHRSFVQVENLVTMPDESGNVQIKGLESSLIEEIIYSKKMHYPLLEDEEGVSLERISARVNSLDPDNWTSSSRNSGFGTPGLPNSQLVNSGVNNSFVELFPPIFSPDGDGYYDQLKIQINTGNQLASASIEIFSENGNSVKTLAVNSNLGSKDTFFWDGFFDDNRKASIGNYIILVTIFDPRGASRRIKKVVGIGGYIK
jgi:Lamin Tail Domain